MRQSGSVTRVRVSAARRKFAPVALAVLILATTRPAMTAPDAPTPLGPAHGASVTVPFALSWSTVSDPTGAEIIGYNWKVSSSSTMTPPILMDSTGGTTTQDTVSGLVPGTYFWQVQAANSAGQQGPWSTPQSFIVTGAGPGTPGTPVLNPTRGYSTFHPYEAISFSWSEVPDAVTYRLEVSNDPSFPVGSLPPGVVTFANDNIRGTTDGFVTHPSLGEGTFYARVFATDSDFAGGVRSLPSNVIQYTVFYNNPIGPPPNLLSPVNGETLTLPVTLTWEHVPNPQPSGYIWEVATDENFSSIEAFNNQYTNPMAVLLSLTSGQKFWRVRSQHGLSSPTTNAVTEPSVTGRFTISSAPATPVSVAPEGNPGIMYSGASGWLAVQLTAAVPSGGASVALSSSHPSVVSVPSTIAMPGNTAWTHFPITVGQVTQATVVTLTATLNNVSVSNQLTVRPPTLNDDPLQSSTRATGGTAMTGWVNLEGSGLAGPGGFVVNLSSNSPAASVPSTVTIPAGVSGTSFQITTSAVDTTTSVTITAFAEGVTTQWRITLEPGSAPASFFVRPMSTTNGSQGVVTATTGLGFDQTMQVTSSNPALAAVPNVVTVSAGSGVGFFDITTAAVAEATVVTISVSGGGVTLSHPLTLYPSLPALTSMTVTPSSVIGGASATGTVNLSGPAPTGGVAINLGSSQPRSASVPASVVVPGGATSASFTVTTYPSSTTTVQLSSALDNVFQFTAITVNPPPPPGPSLSAITVNPTTVVGGNSATGTVTLSAAAPSGGTAVTLSDDSAAATLPSSVTVAAGATTANFTVTTISVTTTATVNISGSAGGTTRSAILTVSPPAPAAPSLVSPAQDARPAQPVTFDWTDVANAASYEIQIDNTSTISAPFVANQTVSVSQATIGGLPAQRLWWRVRGVNSAGVAGPFSATRRFTPQAATTAGLSSLSVTPTSVVGPASPTGTVTLTAAAPSGGAVVTLTSSNAGVASVPASVTVAAGATSANFSVSATAVAANTNVTLTATYNAANRTTTLTVTPPASLSSLAFSPTTVTGGNSSSGTVTLTAAAPAGGAVVTLTDDSGATAVPGSVTVAAGATTATFTVTTTSVSTSTVSTITATYNGATRSATVTVNPPSTTATLTVTASGRSGERVISNPAGINVTVGSTGSASFAVNTSITLSVSNNRDAIWSGACSSGGNKARTCTFTLTGDASVTANVQ